MLQALLRVVYPYIPFFIKKFLIMLKIRRAEAMSEYRRRVTIPFNDGTSSYPPYEREREY